MRLRTRLVNVALVAALSATGAFAVSGVASASSAKAEVTVVHGIPNTPVNVYVNNKLTLKDFVFGKVAGPLSLAPGRYSLAVRAYGSAATSKPILSATVRLTAGENASVVANLTATGTPELSVFANPTAAVMSGDARVIVRHVAEAPGVDVYAGATTSPAVITDLLNGKSATVTVPAGTYPISVYATGMTTSPVLGPDSLTFAAGQTYIIYAIGSATASPATITVAEQKY